VEYPHSKGGICAATSSELATMSAATISERETLLILFKDFAAYYNANSISKVLKISHVGAQKIFKRLLKENLVKSQKIGKSIIYKLKLEDDYVCKLASFLLADEANSKFKRWKEEFKALSKEGRIVMLFGSVTKNYAVARDIDIITVVDKKGYKEVKKILNEKQELLPKALHSIEMTEKDLIANIKTRKGQIMGIIKNSIILYGQDKYVEIIKNFPNF